MSGDPLLELQGLSVARGGSRVLDIPSFRLQEREIVALIGPNGAGKSSLLMAMMALLPRSAGRLLHRGREIRTERDAVALRRRMAMVLQDPLLFDATVHDNVAAGLRLRGLDGRETRRRVLAYLERFRLLDMADRAARRLSGGEARRVNLARALAVEPEVVLLDEPFAGLDLPTRQAITDDLERTIRERGMAAVLVTHDQSEALRLCDRIAVVHRGAIVQSDVPSVVMNHPVNGFVAASVGMETILDGLVRRRSGWEIVIDVAGREIDALGEAQVGDPVYCCVRPEQVTIEVVDPSGISSARNVFPARIGSVTSVGPYLKLRLDCGFPLVAHVTGESFSTLGLSAGKSVFVSIKATAIHVIRKADGAQTQRTPPQVAAERRSA
jgi:tungstate transport system ATP-binding protein